MLADMLQLSMEPLLRSVMSTAMPSLVVSLPHNWCDSNSIAGSPSHLLEVQPVPQHHVLPVHLAPENLAARNEGPTQLQQHSVKVHKEPVAGGNLAGGQEGREQAGNGSDRRAG